jgi:hypothetical protein
MAGRTLGWPASVLVLSFALCYVQALDNGLGLKPPMGVSAVPQEQREPCVCCCSICCCPNGE